MIPPERPRPWPYSSTGVPRSPDSAPGPHRPGARAGTVKTAACAADVRQHHGHQAPRRRAPRAFGTVVTGPPTTFLRTGPSERNSVTSARAIHPPGHMPAGATPSGPAPASMRRRVKPRSHGARPTLAPIPYWLRTCLRNVGSCLTNLIKSSNCATVKPALLIAPTLRVWPTGAICPPLCRCGSPALESATFSVTSRRV